MIAISTNGMDNEVSQYEIKEELTKKEYKKYSLYLNGVCWTPEVKGKKRISIIDNEDGYKIKIHNKIIDIDYADFDELRILLNYVNKKTDNSTEQYFKEIG